MTEEDGSDKKGPTVVIDQQEEGLDSILERLDSLRATISKGEAALRMQKKKLSQRRATLGPKIETHEELVDKIRTAEEEMERCEETISAAATEHDEYAKRYGRVEGEKNFIEVEWIEAKGGVNKNFNEELTPYRQAFEEAKRLYEERKKQLNQKYVIQLREKKIALDARKSKLEIDIQNIAAKRDEAAKKGETARARFEELQRQHETYQSELSQMEATFSDAESEVITDAVQVERELLEILGQVPSLPEAIGFRKDGERYVLGDGREALPALPAPSQYGASQPVLDEEVIPPEDDASPEDAELATGDLDIGARGDPAAAEEQQTSKPTAEPEAESAPEPVAPETSASEPAPAEEPAPAATSADTGAEASSHSSDSVPPSSSPSVTELITTPPEGEAEISGQVDISGAVSLSVSTESAPPEEPRVTLGIDGGIPAAEAPA
ncbi:MAG: hypothetical protein KJ574_02445, partial [Nanoarchaeota archaeon]|nr:hypothetical protein [Nanoarchaeota archaeon]